MVEEFVIVVILVVEEVDFGFEGVVLVVED